MLQESSTDELAQLKTEQNIMMSELLNFKEFDDDSSDASIELRNNRTTLNSGSRLLETSDPLSSNSNRTMKTKTTFKLCSKRIKNQVRCKEPSKTTRRKMLLNSGQKYISRNGKVHEGKKLGPVCHETCRLKCYAKFDYETRQEIHNAYWGLADHSKQWQFITRYTERFKKRSITTDNDSRRKYTMKYYLPSVAGQEDSFQRQHVCKTTFKNTLNVSNVLVATAYTKLEQGNMFLDFRGRHSNHPLKMDSFMVKSVCDHVMSLISTNLAKLGVNKKLYIDNSLTFTKMFNLYQEWNRLKEYNNQARNVRHYRDIVKKYMDIEFMRSESNER